MATNIAAVSFVSRKSGHKKQFYAGLLLIGRLITFCILGFCGGNNGCLLLWFHTLQKYMNMFLGPLLIITALFLIVCCSTKLFRINFNFKFPKYIDGCGAFVAYIIRYYFCIEFLSIQHFCFRNTDPLHKNRKLLLFCQLSWICQRNSVVLFSFIMHFQYQVVKNFQHNEKIEYLTTKITE